MTIDCSIEQLIQTLEELDMTEDERVDEAFAALSDLPTLRDLLEELREDVKELRQSIFRIEGEIACMKNRDHIVQQQWSSSGPFVYTSTMQNSGNTTSSSS